MKTLTPAEFIDQYRPIPNRLDQHAGYDGYLHEISGPSYQIVQAVLKQDPNCVWTYLDSGGDEAPTLCNGFSYVNRLGYVITEKPADDDLIEVIDD